MKIFFTLIHDTLTPMPNAYTYNILSIDFTTTTPCIGQLHIKLLFFLYGNRRVEGDNCFQNNFPY